MAIATQLYGQKILSSKKRCGDPQCEGMMIRASARQDYQGPDCRFLSFRVGEEINVYYKLTGERDDLWQGSTGKAYGFFPRDAVTIEEVYSSQEVEVPAQEIDFLCLDGGDYVFENEDSVLHKVIEGEEEFLKATDLQHRRAPTPIDGTSTQDSQDEVTSNEPKLDVEDKSSWAPSGIASWFGMGRTGDKEDLKAKAEHPHEDHILIEQLQENKGSESQDPEDTQPKKSGWLGGRLQYLLPFGGKGTQDGQASVKSLTPSEEPLADTDANVPSSPQEPEQEKISETNHKEESKSKWLNFDIKNVLGFGGKKELDTEDLQKKMNGADSIGLTPTQDNVEGLKTEPDKTPASLEAQPATAETKKDQEPRSDLIKEDHMVSNEPDGGGWERHQLEGEQVALQEPNHNVRLSGLNLDTRHGNEKEDPKSTWLVFNISNNLGFGEKKEDVSQSQDTTPTMELQHVLNLTEHNSLESNDGQDKDGISVVAQPVTIETKKHKELQPDILIEGASVSSEPNKGMGQMESEQQEFQATNQEVSLPDASWDSANSNQHSIFGELEPSREGVILTNFKDQNPDLHMNGLSMEIEKEVDGLLTDLDDSSKVDVNVLRKDGGPEETTPEHISLQMPEGLTDTGAVMSTLEHKFGLEEIIKPITTEQVDPKLELLSEMKEEPHGRPLELSAAEEGRSINSDLVNVNLDLTLVKKDDFETESIRATDPHKMIQEKAANAKAETLKASLNDESKRGTDNEDDVIALCNSEEESARGYCTIQPGRPGHTKESGVRRPALTYPILPSAEAVILTLHKISGKCLEVHHEFVSPAWSVCTEALWKVVSLLPEDLQPGPHFYGCSWEVVTITALVGLFTVLAFTCRTVRCIKSRFYAGRESKLGEKVAEILNSKSEVLEKLSLVQKQYEEVQQALQDSGHQKLLEEISEQKSLQETLQVSNRELEENIARLERDLEEEKHRGTELDNTLSELNEKIQALEENFRKEKSLKEETRTTQKVFEINKGRLESSLQDAEEERTRLQKSIKQLSKEAEGWEERLGELSENSKMISSSVQVMQDDLSDKQGQVKSLIDSLLKMKDWSSHLEEDKDEAVDDALSSIKWDFENGEPLGDPQKQIIKKLIFAAMLNASLKSAESDKKQLYENLSDEMKAKEQLSECISNLQNTNQSLSLEKGHLEEEVEKLKQKMSVMMEVYQENERKLHRKLTVQEKERLQKEAKLSKADEKVILAGAELVTVKTRLTELEEEIERTVASYQTQVTSYEKKAHDNWLTAREAERCLSDVKKDTLHLRQKLTEAEYKAELLEKDPFALDVIQSIGRAYADVYIIHQETSPYGLSPINRIPEGRAFLSPPTLLEGPLRLSPMPPAAGMRPPGYYPGFPGPKERADVNADRKSDHQRTLSDAGSLSPPWDREQRSSAPPPGLPYPEAPFPPRRAERFYHYPPPSGRFSGPAELTRNQGKPFVDSADGRSSRNGADEANNVPGAPTTEGEAVDGMSSEYLMHPPPPMRVPLLPMDPRAPFFRRPYPMPPPPHMEMYGPPGYPGMPPPHLAMRGPLPPPPHRFLAYPMPNDPYYSLQHPRPPMRQEPSTENQPVSLPGDSASDHAPETQT
ncbi:melanoma inhibitory activity protein 2 [Gastrophryne carolinensis]